MPVNQRRRVGVVKEEEGAELRGNQYGVRPLLTDIARKRSDPILLPFPVSGTKGKTKLIVTTH